MSLFVIWKPKEKSDYRSLLKMGYTFTTRLSWTFRDPDSVTWCQVSTSLHNPFIPRVFFLFFTSTQVVLSSVTSAVLLHTKTHAPYDPFMHPKPIPHGRLLHSAKVGCQHGIQLWLPMDHSICVFILKKHSQNISLQWYWSLSNHGQFLSFCKPTWIVPVEQRFHLSGSQCKISTVLKESSRHTADSLWNVTSQSCIVCTALTITF